jgi:PAS domain S-box-containing protein
MSASFHGFRSLVENSPDAISLINAEGQILYGSASTAKIFGYRPEEMVGRNCLDLMHPEDREHSTRALKSVVAEPEAPRQWNLRVRHKDGNYCWVESTVTNLLLELEVQAIVLQQRDIHARKAAEVEKQQRAEELASSNLRLEEFAHHVAHDLREPLHTVSLYAQLLLRKTKLEPNAQQMAETIVAGATRMAALVDSLLSFADTGLSEALQWVDLEATVADATQNLAISIQESGATVTIDRLPIVRGCEIHLLRIFQNLIGNALKYRGERPVEIFVNGERRGPSWVIRVEDNGVGVARENQKRIFEPFVRVTHKHVPGTGLGLAVCKKIVEGQGGAIWVESKPGMGAAFCFTVAAEKEESLVPMISHSSVV